MFSSKDTTIGDEDGIWRPRLTELEYCRNSNLGPSRSRPTSNECRITSLPTILPLTKECPYILLSVIGSKTYALLRSLTAPDMPSTKSLEALIDALMKHYEPKPLLIAERFHFNRRNQAAGESIAEYAAELRRLAVTCEFQDFLDDALRDRLVCGLRSKSAQKRLLSEEKINFAQALDLAMRMESAEKNAKA